MVGENKQIRRGIVDRPKVHVRRVDGQQSGREYTGDVMRRIGDVDFAPDDLVVVAADSKFIDQLALFIHYPDR